MDFISDYNTYEATNISSENDFDKKSLKAENSGKRNTLNIDFLNSYKNMTMSKIIASTNNLSQAVKRGVGSDFEDINQESTDARFDALISRNLKKMNSNFLFNTKVAGDSINIVPMNSLILKDKTVENKNENTGAKDEINNFVHIVDNSDSLFHFQKGVAIIDDLLKESENFIEDDVHFTFSDKSMLLEKNFYGKITREFLELENNRLQLKKLNIFLSEYSKVDAIINSSTKKMDAFKEANLKITNYKKNLIPASDLNIFNQKLKLIQHDKLQLKVLKNLQKLFSLSALEEHILHNEKEVNEETFQVIEKLQKIKERCISIGNCSNLLKKIETDLQYGLTKLYNYLVNSLNETNLNDIIIQKRKQKTIKQFQTQIFYLSENDLELYQNFINKFVDIEYKKITTSFLHQFDLSSKDNNNPIYLNIDEPTRYLGDVLAYVHSLILNEYEFIQSLFITDNKGTMGKLFEDLDVKLLNDIFNKFNNLVKIRLDQVIKFEDNSSILIQCVQVLSFYKMMFLKSKLPRDNLIIKLLNSLLSYCDDLIIRTTEKYLNEEIKYKKSTNLSAADLQHPHWLFQYLQKLSVILSNFDDFKTLENFDITFYKKFDKSLIENPFVYLLNDQIGSAYPSKLTSKDLNIKIASLILKCNCLDLIESRLLLPFKHTFFQDEVNQRTVYELLTNEFDECKNSLKEITLKILLKNLEVYDYYNLLNMIFPISEVKTELDYEMYYSVADNPIITLDAIERAVKLNFEEQLPLLMTNLESQLLLNLISSPLITNDILNDSFKKFFKFYKTFHNILILIFPNDLKRLELIFNYTDEEVYTILGLENYMDEDIYIEKDDD
ncbi:hypothetical protein QEN19_000727 [Hanseniaspora menglaensis]